MTKFRISFGSAVLGAAVFCSAPVLATTFVCDLKDGADGGAVPLRVILAVDEEKNVGSAFDGFIKEVHGLPIPVEYKRESASRHRFDWTLKNVPGDDNKTYTLSYTARVNPKTLSINLSGRLHGYDNQIRGYGKCKVVK